MTFFVRAVISGFGFSLGKYAFDKLKERITGEEPGPQRVVVENVGDFPSVPGADPDARPN